MQLEIANRRWFWVIEASVWTLLTFVPAALVAGIGVDPGAHDVGYWLIPVCVAWFAYSGYLTVGCWQASRGASYLTVSEDAVQVHLPGVLCSDLVLDRSEVQSVSLAEGLFPYGRPASRGSPIVGLIRNWRQVMPPPELRPMLRTPFNRDTLPDLSGLAAFRTRNFVLLLAEPKDIKKHVRWGLGWLQINLYADTQDYSGPTRSSTAHGFCARLTDLDDATLAFQSWPQRPVSQLPLLPEHDVEGASQRDTETDH